MTDAFELPSTLAHALQRRAALSPDRVALRFLADVPEQSVVLSYRDLDLRARTIAAALQAEAAFGDRAVLLFPSGPDYVAAFLDRKSTRLNPVTNAHLVCRLLLEKKKHSTQILT